MNIDPKTLLAEYQTANHQYPVIHAAEVQYHLPRFLLFAVGSRETNLRNVVGDGGHGHGMFQLDNRSHIIPPGFDNDVRAQALRAASMLHALILHWPGDLKAAVSSYNTGVGGAAAGIHDSGDSDRYTAGGDYAADVLARMASLQHQLPIPGTPKPPVSPPPAGHPTKVYQVKAGDTLTAIAQRLHIGGGWTELWHLNQHIIPNPDRIYPGQVLRLP